MFFRESRDQKSPGIPSRFLPAFTLLEVLVALAVLSVTLLAVHQGFSSTLYVNMATRGLWKAVSYSNNELLRWERLGRADVSLSQGQFPPGDEMAGYSWKREISDREPFPGIRVRRVRLTLTWTTGNATQSYQAETYVDPR